MRVFYIVMMLPMIWALQLHKFITDDFIRLLNSKDSTWTAARNFPENTTSDYLEKLVGNHGRKSLDNTAQFLYHTTNYYENFLPDYFDAREKWSMCEEIIGNVKKQNNCDGWAFGAASVMSDRLCIQTGGSKKIILSAEDIASCCNECKLDSKPCGRRLGSKVWDFWIDRGVVSGGNNGCKPYAKSTSCTNSCTNHDYTIPFALDKHFGGRKYKLPQDVAQIQIELFLNGPVTAEFEVFSDFLNYQEGVYVHLAGVFMGHHVVKILGWGGEMARPYWLCANSWGGQWGALDGFFKILKGTNHCGIEANVMAGRIETGMMAREVLLDIKSGCCCLGTSVYVSLLQMLILKLIKEVGP